MLKVQAKSHEESGGWYYRSYVARRRKAWRGPRYLLPGTREKDLDTLLNELMAIIKTNAPLAAGVEAAGMEYRRRQGHLSSGMMKSTLAVAAILFLMIPLLLPLLGSGLQFVATGRLSVSVVGLLVFAGFLAWVREVLLRRPRREALFLALRDRLQQGQQLSEALASLSRVVPEYLVDLVRAGEHAGRLHETLEDVRDRLLTRNQARNNISHALLYGAFVLTNVVLITAFSIVKLLPVFREITDEFGETLPQSAQELQAVGDWLLYHGLQSITWVCLGTIAVLLLVRVIFRSRKRCLQMLELPLFYLPMARRTLLQAHLAPACQVLAMLLKAGVPLPAALAQAQHLHVHPRVQASLARLQAAVEMGEPLADASRAEGFRLPHSFATMVALGEQSGMLPGALDYLADLYGDNTLLRQRILGQLVLPAVVLCLGGMVLFVELAMYQSIWMIADVIFYSL